MRERRVGSEECRDVGGAQPEVDGIKGCWLGGALKEMGWSLVVRTALRTGGRIRATNPD